MFVSNSDQCTNPALCPTPIAGCGRRAQLTFQDMPSDLSAKPLTSSGGRDVLPIELSYLNMGIFTLRVPLLARDSRVLV